MSRLLDVLRSGRVLLMDGAMGTELQRAGLKDGERGELWNVRHPDRVRAIHQAYVAAGADCLLTNTFQANLTLPPAAELSAVLACAMDLARSAAGVNRFVLLDVGPLGLVETARAADLLIRAAVEGGADAVLVETASTTGDLEHLLHARQRSGLDRARLPILMSWTFLRQPDSSITTIGGQTPEACARQTTAEALGVNCGRDFGIEEMARVIRAYRGVTEMPLFARPNAGTPTREGDAWIYKQTPSDLAAAVSTLLGAGVSMIGGCCGTTPAHIAALRPIVDAWNSLHQPDA